MMPRAALLVMLVFATSATTAAQQTPAPPRPPAVNGGIPAASPTGRHIAFASWRTGARTVMIMPVDGGEAVKLLDGGAPGRLGWTPDGNEVLVAHFANDTSRLVAVRALGGAQRPVATVVGRDPTLSPDGRRVLFMAGPWQRAKLTLANVDGADARVLSDPSAFMTYNATWSPDGRHVAYARMDSAMKADIRVMNADGTGSRVVSRIDEREGSAQWPSWSADGRRLAVQVGRYDRGNPAASTAHIWVLDVATGAATKLAPHERPYLDETPSWLPDGRIAFQSDRTGRMEVWVMNGDGTDARQLTR